jgi:hypothetical protein
LIETGPQGFVHDLIWILPGEFFLPGNNHI